MPLRVRPFLAGLLLAGVCASPSFAFDGRGGSAGDASRGYGAERPYYGAERFGRHGGWAGDGRRGHIISFERENRSAGDASRGYGAERFHRPGEWTDSGWGSDIVVFEAPPLGVERRAGYVSPFGVDDASAGVYPGGFGRPATSFVYRGFDGDRPSRDGSFAGGTGARVIDVETERLDARPIGPSGIDVVYSGGAKIIRIAPDYRLATASRASREDADDAAGLRPWSEAWRRYCRRAHPDFDPTTGLYRTAGGETRFCRAR